MGKSEVVIKGSSNALRSSKADIISMRGGYKEVRTLWRVHETLPTSFKTEEPQSSSPPIYDGGLVWGVIFSFILWAIGIGLILWSLPSHALPIGTTLNFSWQPPTTNTNGTPWTDRGSYRFYESRDGGPFQIRAGIHPDYPRLSYRPPGSGSYRYRVTATTRYARPRLESAPSNIVSVVIDPPPPPPPSPTPTPD